MLRGNVIQARRKASRRFDRPATAFTGREVKTARRPLGNGSSDDFRDRDVRLGSLGSQKACLLFAELDLHPDHNNAIMMSNSDVIILSNDVVWEDGERLRLRTPLTEVPGTIAVCTRREYR